MALRTVSVVALIALSAGTALAARPTGSNSLFTNVSGNTASTGVYADRADVLANISGTASWDSPGDANNVVLLFDLAAALGAPSGTLTTMTGIGWDVILRTTLAGPFGGSWLDEATIEFGAQGGPSSVNLRVGAGNNFGDTLGAPFSSGVIDFFSVSIPDIVLPNGVLQLEFSETFDDSNGEVDAFYDSLSTLTIRGTAIPAPTALAVLGLGGVLAGRRRR